jgi:Domain of Unknown Function with PDB structure (DUF3857)/Transglutaminase-like superfamily
MLSRFALSVGFLALSAMPAIAGEQAPAWLKQAAQIETSTYDNKVMAVVLVDEGVYTVSEDGRVTTTASYAIRLLRHEARESAIGRVVYLPDTAKVKELNAWLIRTDGSVKRYGKEQAVDELGSPNDVYNEVRVRSVSAQDDADTGMVFGFSYTTEDRSIFSQDKWFFQESNPVIASRYSLVLPAGWRAQSVTFNHAPIEPKVNGSTYTWELTNLPPLPSEPASPSWSNLVPRLAVSYFPPAETQAPGIKTFANWSDVGGWLHELEESQSAPSEPLAAKARELTVNARTEYEKIRAIGNYVQKVQYISIQTNIGHGGGYRPHAAADVFAKSYGDCKDKANLMRAMLRVVGIDAVLVSIYSGDPDYVRAEWPSPGQFNHCIIAVKVGSDTQAATVIEHPRLGRLLIFDPTAEETPVGDLPFYLQGSLALLDLKDADALVHMPSTPAEMNRLERSADLQLAADGEMTGAIQERAQGQIAAIFRSEFRQLSRSEYNSAIAHWLANGAPGSRISKVEPTDDVAAGRFALNVTFVAPSYAQLMQNRLLVFKPAVVSRRDELSLTASKRKHPVVLRSNAYSETVRIKLPSGFDVDELPDAVKLDTAFGNYSTSYDVKDGQLTFKRSLVQHAMTIPVEQYAAVRTFFERIRAAELAPVVLARQ